MIRNSAVTLARPDTATQPVRRVSVPWVGRIRTIAAPLPVKRSMGARYLERKFGVRGSLAGVLADLAGLGRGRVEL